MFLDLFNLPYEWAPPEKADLIGIGSLLEKIPDDYKGVVWSTGSMFQMSRQLPKAKILALRGPLTLKNISGKPSNVALGDGGLLCHLLAETCAKRFKLGVIPHFVDQGNVAVKELTSRNPNVCVIDICAPTFDVIQQAAACDYIVSSSLHGLILADSMEVPNQWVEFSSSAESISGGGFKFRDYYSNFGLEGMRPIHVSGRETIDFFLHSAANYTRPSISKVKQNLLNSLEQLTLHFGGDFQRPVDLDRLRTLEHANGVERENWNLEVSRVLTLLAKYIPAKERFVLIDEEQIRSEVLKNKAIPFIEENGEYGGVPLDDRHAIEQAQQHRRSGIQHVAFTEACFWWLEEYPEFRKWLSSTSVTIHDDDVLKIFRFC